MPDLLSEHYAAVVSAGVSPAVIDDPLQKLAAGQSHSKLHYKRGSVFVVGATAAGAVLRFFPLKSSDRIIELVISHTVDASTTVTANIGLYDSIQDGSGGALIDLDLFNDVGDVPMADITIVMRRLDVFASAASVLDNEDRGKMLWELADEGAASHSKDPIKSWDICMTILAETGIVASEYVLECIYAGGSAS